MEYDHGYDYVNYHRFVTVYPPDIKGMKELWNKMSCSSLWTTELIDNMPELLSSLYGWIQAVKQDKSSQQYSKLDECEQSSYERTCKDVLGFYTRQMRVLMNDVIPALIDITHVEGFGKPKRKVTSSLDREKNEALVHLEGCDPLLYKLVKEFSSRSISRWVRYKSSPLECLEIEIDHAISELERAKKIYEDTVVPGDGINDSIAAGAGDITDCQIILQGLQEDHLLIKRWKGVYDKLRHGVYDSLRDQRSREVLSGAEGPGPIQYRSAEMAKDTSELLLFLYEWIQTVRQLKSDPQYSRLGKGVQKRYEQLFQGIFRLYTCQMREFMNDIIPALIDIALIGGFGKPKSEAATRAFGAYEQKKAGVLACLEDSDPLFYTLVKDFSSKGISAWIEYQDRPLEELEKRIEEARSELKSAEESYDALVVPGDSRSDCIAAGVGDITDCQRIVHGLEDDYRLLKRWKGIYDKIQLSVGGEWSPR